MPFLFAQIQINISYSNEYVFAILYTCIYYNPSNNPVKFRHDWIQNGVLISIFFAQIDNIFESFWKFCLSGWISLRPMNIFWGYFTHTFPTITYNKIFYPVGDTITLAIYLLYLKLILFNVSKYKIKNMPTLKMFKKHMESNYQFNKKKIFPYKTWF